MTIIANNPQTFMNSFLSAIRNTIISLTLGIGIFGFSKTFSHKKSALIMRFLSLVLYVYALATGLNTSLMMQNYLDKLDSPEKKEELEKMPTYINLKYWRNYLILAYAFCFIVAMLLLLASYRFCLKLI